MYNMWSFTFRIEYLLKMMKGLPLSGQLKRGWMMMYFNTKILFLYSINAKWLAKWPLWYFRIQSLQFILIWDALKNYVDKYIYFYLVLISGFLNFYEYVFIFFSDFFVLTLSLLLIRKSFKISACVSVTDTIV